jgi:hypothetical protein
MLKQACSLVVRLTITVCFLIPLTVSTPGLSKTPTAAQLLKQGSSYQAADDTSDRAADIYRQLIRMFPKASEAEAAQFFLGEYYHRKFFILEQRSKAQDWSSLNQAEQELYTYKGKYPRGTYLADAYQLLSTIALRRGYTGSAVSWLETMKKAASSDQKVYIYRMTWSPNTSDVVKRYCDTRSLADVTLSPINRRASFNAVIEEVTTWARSNCTSVPSSNSLLRRQRSR